MQIDQLETPVAVVDLDKVEANINQLQSYLDKHQIANRPHIKTHKIPEIAHMQMDAGAIGICCQKVGEAEVMVQAGIKDIFIPYNIMGESKLERLTHLAKRANISVAADSEYTVRGLSKAGQNAGVEIPILIEIESGYNRCGVQTPQACADLAQVIDRSHGVRFDGIMSYPMNEQSNNFVTETRALLKASGLSVNRFSSGGSPVMWQVHTHSEVTEHRAGTYVYGDRNMIAAGVKTVEQCAMTVIATVVSRPTAYRGILDGGSKTFSSDTDKAGGYGLILEYPEAQVYGFTEEHGHVDFSQCTNRPDIGERVTVIPNHCCVVTNLFNEIVGVRRGEVEVVWPVVCRGLLQ